MLRKWKNKMVFSMAIFCILSAIITIPIYFNTWSFGLPLGDEWFPSRDHPVVREIDGVTFKDILFIDVVVSTWRANGSVQYLLLNKEEYVHFHNNQTFKAIATATGVRGEMRARITREQLNGNNFYLIVQVDRENLTNNSNDVHIRTFDVTNAYYHPLHQPWLSISDLGFQPLFIFALSFPMLGCACVPIGFGILGVALFILYKIFLLKKMKNPNERGPQDSP